jgi:hypothetical protein
MFVFVTLWLEIVFLFFFFFVVLRFEFQGSHLGGRCSKAWVMPSVHIFALVNFWLVFSQSMILLLMSPTWLEWQAYTTWLAYELGWSLASFCLAWHQTTILPISTSQKAYSFLSPNVIIIVNYKSSPKHLKITFLFTSSFPSHLSPLIFLSTCFSLVVLASGRISSC